MWNFHTFLFSLYWMIFSLFLLLVKLSSLFRQYLWMQTIFAYPPLELLKPGYSLVVFFFCKLFIVLFGFVLDLFLSFRIFAIILWSCWLRLLFAILDYSLRLYFSGILCSFFRLHLSAALNFSRNISNRNMFEISNVRWITCTNIDCTLARCSSTWKSSF